MDSSSSSSDEFPIFQTTFPPRTPRSTCADIKRYELVWNSTDTDVTNSDNEDELELKLPNPKLRARNNHFDRWNDEEFLRRFRVTKGTAIFILNQIEAEIAKLTKRNRFVSPMDQLLLVLRLLGSCNIKKTVAEFSGVCKTSVCRILRKVITAIARLRGLYITTPQSAEDKIACRKKFEQISRFPKVLGVLATTHVKIKSPGASISKPFRNNYGFLSLKVQVLADANLIIQDIEAEWPGGTDDDTLFKNTRLFARLRSGEFGDSVVVADRSYALRKYVITPLRYAETDEENAFQLAHASSFDTGLKVFDDWRQRFPILSAELRLSLQTTKTLIVAVAVLYNICKMRRDAKPPNDTDVAVDSVEVMELPNKEFEDEDYREPFIQHFIPKESLTD